jgi:hypothetical protein
MRHLDDPSATPGDAALAAVAEVAHAIAIARVSGVDPREVIVQAALAVAGADLAVLRLPDGLRLARRPDSPPLPAGMQALPPGPGVPQALLDADGCNSLHAEPFDGGLLAVAWRDRVDRLPREIIAAIRVLADLAAVANERARLLLLRAA